MSAHLSAGERGTARPGFGPVAAVLLSGALLGGALTACTGNAPILDRIKRCESGGNYRAVNRSSGASGAYQFLDSTWRAMPESRGYAKASYAPAWLQDQAARRLYARYGIRPWIASSSCWAR